MAGAAVFDLDRTVVAGSFTAEALHPVTDDPSLGGLAGRVLSGWFRLRGETRTTAVISRNALAVVAEMAPDELAAAGRSAAERVEPLGWVADALDRHRREGRRTVLATATPRELCEPFADQHGFDAIVATELCRGRPGSLEGRYVWGKGKVAAVHHWMLDSDLRLEHSAAYSDSVFDLPLLDAVGEPTVVNPDRRLDRTARRRRWPVIEVGEVADALMPLDLQRLITPWMRNELNPVCRVEMCGASIPEEGPFVLDVPASSPRDIAEAVSVVGELVRRADRPVYLAFPSWVLDTPMIGGVVAAIGGIRDVPAEIRCAARAGHGIARIGAAEPLDAEFVWCPRLVLDLVRTRPRGDEIRPTVQVSALPLGS